VHLLRGCAALAVLLQHSGYFVAEYSGTDFKALLKVDFGTLGVLTFFCISGFVIGLIRHTRTEEFAIRRILRIYPPFWVAWLISAGLVSLIGKHTDFSLWTALLLPSDNLPAIYVTMWTLIFEVFFYAFAGVLFALRLSDRALTIVMLAWILLIQYMQGYIDGQRFFIPGAFIPIAQYNQLFALGLLCAVNLDKTNRFSALQFLVVAIVAATIMRFLPPLPDAGRSLIFGVSICGVMLAMTRISTIGFVGTKLGDISYGLFLIHFSVICSLGAALKPYQFSAGFLWVILFAAGLCAGIAFGLVDHWFYRRSANVVVKWLRSIRRADAPRARELAMSGNVLPPGK
jgi:peptidoglycan/LPS O-acetylase OafA/YrhL